MEQWITQYSTTNSDATHIHFITKSRLKIGLESKDEFWNEYCSAVADHRNPHLYELVQRHNNHMQLSYNINFVFNRTQVSSSSISKNIEGNINKTVKHIISIIHSLIDRYFDVDKSDELYKYLLYTCHLIKPQVAEDQNIRYSSRIIFPYIRLAFVHINMFYEFLLPQIQIEYHKIVGILKISPLNTVEDIFQKQNLDRVELYGSSLSINETPYRLYKCYGDLYNEFSDGEVQLSQIFVPTEHLDVKYNHVEISIDEETPLEHWLPLFFSIDYRNDYISPREEFTRNGTISPELSVKYEISETKYTSNLDKARQLITIISTERLTKYGDWLDIGQALYTVSSSNESLELWKWFTRKDDFQDTSDCEEQWETFTESNAGKITINTLKYFAYQDNPEGYRNLVKASIDSAMLKAVTTLGHNSIAKAFIECFPFDYICTNYNADNIWYEYKRHRYVRTDSGPLMQALSDSFVIELERYKDDLDNISKSTIDPAQKASSQNTKKLVQSLIDKLENGPFKERICKEIRIYARRTDFNKWKDIEPCFFGCPNGVIDLRGGKPEFRPGKPEDYITLQGTKFPENYTWNYPAVKDCMKYMSQIYRDPVERDFMWRLFASRLRSGNMDKIFPVLLGKGNNSKSMLVRLIVYAFCTYSGKMPSLYITESKKDSGKADPILSHSQGMKIMFLQEPDKNDPIRSGTVKELTGNDSMYIRELFQKGGDITEMEITIVPFLIANTMPVIPDCQQAIWERILLIKHNSTWKHDAPKTEEEQFDSGVFQIDKFFDTKVQRLASAFLWILFHKYSNYIDEGLKVPDSVKAATEDFRVNNNYYIHFTRDTIKPAYRYLGEDAQGNKIQELDTDSFVTLREMYGKFKIWYKDQHFKDVLPTQSIFKENIETVWKTQGEATSDGNIIWRGLHMDAPVDTRQTQQNHMNNLFTFT